MTADSSVKTLVKILIGAAWIDGKIQPEEREYLRRIAKEKGVANEPEIQPLLYELRAVTPEECYGWVKDYLGSHPTPEQYQQLIEAISGLIYSDGTVATEEARLLTNLQQMDGGSPGSKPGDSPILKAIRELYQNWMHILDS